MSLSVLLGIFQVFHLFSSIYDNFEGSHFSDMILKWAPKELWWSAYSSADKGVYPKWVDLRR